LGGGGIQPTGFKNSTSIIQMPTDEKPIVFLSHSSLDKAPLNALKKILDERTSCLVNFFLSSDGESIKFGRNWVVSVSDALAKAKLMFVFLSPRSADSKWIHFEAGYACAKDKDFRVVPVCLPGIDLDRITPPLGLLHGFNLHSHEAMGNLSRICNDVLSCKIPETFSSDEFEKIAGKIIGHGFSFFGDYSWAVDEIKISSVGDIPSHDFCPIPKLEEISKQAKMKCRAKTRLKNAYMAHDNGLLISDFEQPGCVIMFEHKEDANEKDGRLQRAREQGKSVTLADKPIPKKYSFDCSLSPELFHVNAPLLDQWFETAKFALPLNVQICFRKNIDAEKQRQRLTAKLYQSGIGLLENGHFEFDGYEFDFGQYGVWKIHFQLAGKLEDKRLSGIIERMFESIVLWQHEPDLSELFS
jgi:TIR domain